jgi:hypothetical protein
MAEPEEISRRHEILRRSRNQGGRVRRTAFRGEPAEWLGTFETCQPAQKLSANRGRPEVIGA